MKTTSLLNLLAALLLIAVVPASVTTADEPIEIGSRRELFVDTLLVAGITGDATRKLHQPEPREVVLVTGEPWEGNTCAYYTIFQDGDLYRMYYRGSHFDEQTKKGAHPEVTCYAESHDGIHWTKPQLGLHEFNGSKANNIILTGLGTHCFVAFKDENPDCPPAARYKGISSGVGGANAPKGLYVFQSPDGIRWELIRNAPVITEGAFDSQNLAFWHPLEKQYVDYHRIFVGGVRAIMRSTSSDYVNWSTPQLLKYPGAPDQHLYTNAIRPYPRAPHLYVGFPTRYLPEGQSVEPVFMSSRDGVTFDRWSEPVIPQSAPEDRAGNRSNYMANGLVVLPESDREYAVYGTEAYYTGPDSRLRRFSYRLDGFVSLHAGSDGGTLITKPLTYKGTSLLLNFAAPQGSVRVSVHAADDADGSGEPLARSEELSGDEIDHAVTFATGKLAEHSGRPVRLRFDLKNADVYSFKFEGTR
jgi:hypothetical protein